MRPTAVLLATAVVLLLLVSTARGEEGDCRSADAAAHNRTPARPLKIAAFFSILICGALGCSLPVLGRRVPVLWPDGDVFFLVKAFAAGVILATRFIHILPNAFENLTSPCLPTDGLWKDFRFARVGAMVGAIGTLVDTIATGYFVRAHMNKDAAHAAAASSATFAVIDEENQAAVAAAEEASHQEGGEHQGHMHTHMTHGHTHGSAALVAAVGDGKRTKRTRSGTA